VGDDVQFLFAFNHSERAAAAKISVRVPWPVREARSVNGQEKVAFRQSGEGLTLDAPLAANGIWVVRFDRECAARGWWRRPAPSPGPRRLMKAPSQSTLSPEGERGKQKTRIPLPLGGEGGPQPAFSSAGAGRVRGFDL